MLAFLKTDLNDLIPNGLEGNKSGQIGYSLEYYTQVKVWWHIDRGRLSALLTFLWGQSTDQRRFLLNGSVMHC